MQGQWRPCQDSICSMLACLWPWATALGNGSVWKPTPCAEFVLNTHSLERNGITHFSGAKKFLFVPPKWGEERQDPIHVSMRKPGWDGWQSSFFGAFKQGTVAYPLLQHSPCNCLNIHCSSVGDCACPGWRGCDFSLTDILIVTVGPCIR